MACSTVADYVDLTREQRYFSAGNCIQGILLRLSEQRGALGTQANRVHHGASLLVPGVNDSEETSLRPLLCGRASVSEH